MKHWIQAALAVALVALPSVSHAAVGCTLSNPARDLKTLFPDMTSYREDAIELSRKPDGREIYEAFKARLGGDLDPVYESFETPFTLYSIFQGDRRIGFVHGVNVPGRGGVIQVFVAMDPDTAAIRKLFFQRLESPGGAALRARAVREQFTGLSLGDFYKHDYYTVAEPGTTSDRIAGLRPPENLPAEALPDWQATLRGLRKNLILLDFFAFERRHEPFYRRAIEALQKKGTPK